MASFKTSLLLTLISLIVLTLVMPASSLALPDKITLTTCEWAPYTSEKMDGGGFATELVRAVFAEMGYKLKVKFYPCSRAIKYVDAGRELGVFPFFINEERKNILFLMN